MSLDQQKCESYRTMREVFLDLGISKCAIFPKKQNVENNPTVMKYIDKNKEIGVCVVGKEKVKEVIETSIVDVETVQLLREARILFKKKLYSGEYDTLFGNNLVIQEGRLFHETEPSMDSKEYVSFRSCKKSVNEVMNNVHLSHILPKELYEKIDKSILDENMIAVLEGVLLNYWSQQERVEKKWEKQWQQQKKREKNTFFEKKSEKEWKQEVEVARIGMKNDLFSRLRKIIDGMMRSYFLLDSSSFFQNMQKDEYADFLNEFLLRGSAFIEETKERFSKNMKDRKEAAFRDLLEGQVDLLF